MARRSLLTADERRRLFDPPASAHEIAQRYTLEPEDLAWIEARRRPENQLGAAVHLALLRHPGFGLRSGEEVQPAILTFLAMQVGVSPELLPEYARRGQTRREHIRELHARLGLRVFTRADVRAAIGIAAAAARSTENGAPIVEALMRELRRRNFVLPPPDKLERIALAGRAEARHTAANEVVAALMEHQLQQVEALLANDPGLGMSRLGWLRDVPETPSATAMSAITERLAFVRAIGIDPSISEAIEPQRFDQFAREGAVAPAYLLSGYSVRRRRATLAAALVDLEQRYNDAAVEMFDRMVGSLFARGRRGRERQFQASSREVSQLMRLFAQVIGAVDGALDDGADVMDRLETQVGWWRVQAVKPRIEQLAALAVQDPLVSAAERYVSLRRFFPPFLEHIRFKASGGGAPTLSAIETRAEPLRPTRGAGQRPDALRLTALEGFGAIRRPHRPPPL